VVAYVLDKVTNESGREAIRLTTLIHVDLRGYLPKWILKTSAKRDALLNFLAEKFNTS
jgi:hypothetical protein